MPNSKHDKPEEHDGVTTYRQMPYDRMCRSAFVVMMIAWLTCALVVLVKAIAWEGRAGHFMFGCACLCLFFAARMRLSRALRYEIRPNSISIIRPWFMRDKIIAFEEIHGIARLYPKKDYTLRDALRKFSSHPYIRGVSPCISGGNGWGAPGQIICELPRGLRFDPEETPGYLVLSGLGPRPPEPFQMKISSWISDVNHMVFISGKVNYVLSPEHPDDFVERVRMKMGHH